MFLLILIKDFIFTNETNFRKKLLDFVVVVVEVVLVVDVVVMVVEFVALKWKIEILLLMKLNDKYLFLL